MSQINQPLDSRLVEETFNRTLLPAVTYFVGAILVFFWKFGAKHFASEVEMGAFFMAALCLARAALGFLGKKKKINLMQYLPMLNAIVIASGGTWAFIFVAVIWELPLISLQMYICFFSITSILSAVPYSLIGNPRIQIYFSTCLGIVPGLVFTYRCIQEGVSFDYFALPFLLLLTFTYVVAHGRNLRAGLMLIFEQQERIQRDLMAAKDIQRSLLPKTIQDFDLAVLKILYRPCEELSGDFFETHIHQDNLLFYIADVTSHGTAAAQVTYLLKAAFRNTIADLGAEINIAEIAQKICEEYVSYKLDYAISLFVASYNFKSGGLQYVTSNFPNPLFISDKATEILYSEANPVIDANHFVINQTFQKSVAVLPKGSRLYVFTDGAYEFRMSKTGREFGYRRFSKLLSDHQIENWVQPVVNELEYANGSAEFDDDMTVLSLYRKNDA